MNKNLLSLGTMNEENKQFTKAAAIDCGSAHFATCVDTDGRVVVIESSPILSCCRSDNKVERGNALAVYLLKRTHDLVRKLASDGVEIIYVGCCEGNFVKLCGGKENHPFINHAAFEYFLDMLIKYAHTCGIKTVPLFDESYTSLASAVSGDYVASYGIDDMDKPEFSGYRNMGTYTINKYLSLNADVNAAVNILHKAGFSLNITTDSNFVDYVIAAE